MTVAYTLFLFYFYKMFLKLGDSLGEIHFIFVTHHRISFTQKHRMCIRMQKGV